MTARARTQAACNQSAADDYAPDEYGWQRHRAAEEAAQWLASLSPERRAQINREWNAK